MNPLWKKWWLGVGLFAVLFFSSLFTWQHFNSPYTTDSTHNATLVQAYEYGYQCGSKSSRGECTKWMGRFTEDNSGKSFDRNIDGFFYHNFVNKGEKPMPAYLQLSREDMGEKTPALGDWAGIGTAVFFVVGLAWVFGGGLYVGLEIDTQERNKEWEKRFGRRP